MAMSEPDAGTDVLGLSTNAVKQADGTWLLNGRKMWITNGVLDEEGTPADVVWVYARTGDGREGSRADEHLPRGGRHAWLQRRSEDHGQDRHACVQHRRIGVPRLRCACCEPRR